MITNEMKRVMVDAAKRCHPKEACGVVAGGHCYELPNQSDDTGHFWLRAEDIARVAADHGGFTAVWHSHPSGVRTPSRTDWAFHPYGKALVIVAGNEVAVYGEEARP